MDKEIERMLEEVIEEEPITREDALFEIVMMLTKASAEQMNLMKEMSAAMKDQNAIIRQLDMRLTSLEMALYPYFKDKGGISEC